MPEKSDRPPQQSDPSKAAPEPRVLNAEELFRGAREICIELDGTRYRLRITRRNKLILQK
jgi:hemin uptake protein HemP